MEEYVNRDGVIVQAERLAEDAEEHAGLWHIVDANGVHGHTTDERFQYNFKPVDAAPEAPAESPTKGKK